jgi:phospholipase/carboxylesterase
VTALAYSERRAAGDAAGLLILHHGRGSDEHDLLPIGEQLDPDRRLHIVAPRAPLTLLGRCGYHWYLVPRVGYPDPDSFHAAVRQLASCHDEIAQLTGIPPERTVLGGFSMGSVMSYALGLGADRPAPAGILAFSGFIPQVERWSADLATRTATRVLITHGRADSVIPVDFGRRARDQLLAGGLPVEYHESDGGHHIDLAQLPSVIAWLRTTLPSEGQDPSAR